MNNTSSIILLLLATHFIFDFVLQSNWMATNKSKNMTALLAHVGTYTIGMFVAGWIVFGFGESMLLFGLLNGVIHFAIDYCTSRVTSMLWSRKEIHYFFVTVGFDQLLHAATLIWTYNLFIR